MYPNIRNEKEMAQYLEYEVRILKLKMYVYKKGYSLSINSNSGLFMVYGKNELDVIAQIEKIDDVYTYFEGVPV